MERATGFEPATSTLARLRATNCAKPASQEVIYASLGTDASTFFNFFAQFAFPQLRGLNFFHEIRFARFPVAGHHPLVTAL